MDHNSSAEKKKRKGISLDVKIQILDRLKTGQGATSVGKYFGVHEATVRTIKKNEAAIRKSVCSGTKLSVKSSAYTRDVVTEKMEKALAIWIEEKSQKRVPVDGNAIKQTALKMYKQIQLLEPGSLSKLNRKYEFSASTGWMTGFLKREALHNIKIKGETASADDLAAEKFPQTLLKIIEEGGYEENPVLNADLLKEGLELATKLGNHFLKHDPDEERAGKFQRELKMLTASYRELYKDHVKTLPQRLITDFAVKFTETSTPKKTGANFDEENTETISISVEQDEDISTDSSDHSISRKRVRRLLSDSDLF